MLGSHRTGSVRFSRHGSTNNRPAHHHRRGRAWRVESLEARTLLSQFIVTNLSDSGGGSLRQAIIDSNSNSTSELNEIDFAPGLSGTISLTTGELLIANHDLKIVGPGQNVLSISGNRKIRVFEVESGVSVSLAGMAITSGAAQDGGAIYNGGTLTVNASTISGNWATRGGGLYNAGTASIIDCTLSASRATQGSGIYSGTGSTLKITGSSLTGNSAYRDGGGIHNDGTMTVTNSTIARNSAQAEKGGHGGGIFSPARADYPQ